MINTQNLTGGGGGFSLTKYIKKWTKFGQNRQNRQNGQKYVYECRQKFKLSVNIIFGKSENPDIPRSLRLPNHRGQRS